MKNAIVQASLQKVRLLVFHECALSSYPMSETVKAKDANFDMIEDCMVELQKLAMRYDMYIAVGSILKRENAIFNSIQMFSPNGETLPSYDKRALWGWDIDNFSEGTNCGIYEIDEIKIGVRLCFEVRFPEYFRELYKERVDLCIVSFFDVTDEECIERYELIKAHLRTRAVENVMTVISVNDIAPFQAAPTAIFDIDGTVVAELERNKAGLLIYDFKTPEKQFGARGRALISDRLLGVIR